MARAPRSLLPDGIYHITTRGVARGPIYLDDDDRLFFLRLLADVRARSSWDFYALCLMDNHYHLVFESTQPLLSNGMQRLNGRYADAFNQKYMRSGHLFGTRFGARMIEDETYLADVCRYVVDNPVRAGLCLDAGEWPWSRSRFGAARS